MPNAAPSTGPTNEPADIDSRFPEMNYPLTKGTVDFMNSGGKVKLAAGALMLPTTTVLDTGLNAAKGGAYLTKEALVKSADGLQFAGKGAMKGANGVIAGTRFGLGKLFRYGKGMTFDAFGKPIYHIGKSALVDTGRLTLNNLGKPILSVISGTRAAAMGALGAATVPWVSENVPGLRWMGSLGRKALQSSQNLVSRAGKQLSTPFQLQNWTDPVKNFGRTVYHGGIAVPTHLLAAQAGVLNDDWSQSLKMKAQNFLTQNEGLLDATFGTRANFEEWDKNNKTQGVQTLLA